MAKNDDKILSLKKQIDIKKEALEKTKFSPKTNCLFSFEGSRIFNINTFLREEAIHYLVTLNSLYMSAKDLGLEDECKLANNNFLLKDYIIDIKGRLKALTYKKDLKVLNDLEKKLETMLSSDKKTELELEGIEDLLK